jgi:hypothetical protein
VLIFKKEFFFVFDAMPFKQSNVFVLEISFLVVLLLVSNVFGDRRNNRLAHRERSITRLPFELVYGLLVFVDPFRGI